MNRQRIVFLLGAATLLAPLSYFIYSPSLVSVREDLGASNALAGASLAVYGLALAFGQLLYGPLVDLFPGRRILLAALAAFVVASALGALAPGIYVLLGIRLAQGLSVAAGQTIGPAYVADLFPARERAAALGLFQTLVLIGGALSPLVGGAIGSTFGWRADFVALAGAGIIMWLAVHRWLPPGQPAVERLTLARATRILRTPATATMCFLGFGQLLCYQAFLAFLPVILVERAGLGQGWIGLLLGTLSGSVLTSAVLGGRHAARRGLRNTFLIGAALAAISSATLSAITIWFDLRAAPWVLAPALAGFGASLGFVLPAAPALMINWFPGLRGTAVGLYNSSRFLGGAIGPVLIGLLVDTRGLAFAFAIPPLILWLGALAVVALVTEPKTADGGPRSQPAPRRVG